MCFFAIFGLQILQGFSDFIAQNLTVRSSQNDGTFQRINSVFFRVFFFVLF